MNRILQDKSYNYIKPLRVDLDNISEDLDHSLRDTERRFKQALVDVNRLYKRYQSRVNSVKDSIIFELNKHHK